MFALVYIYPGYLSGVSPLVRIFVTVRHGSDEYTRNSRYGVS